LSPERKSKKKSSIYVLLDALAKRIKREAKRASLQQLCEDNKQARYPCAVVHSLVIESLISYSLVHTYLAFLV
jgi:hypothetical protein